MDKHKANQTHNTLKRVNKEENPKTRLKNLSGMSQHQMIH